MSNTLATLDELYKEHQKLGANEVILDVRRPDEFSEAHIAGALNIPLDQVAQHVDKLKGYSKVYIHCKRGGRAQTAFQALGQMGLTNLVCIHDAGMDKWIESGYPVSK